MPHKVTAVGVYTGNRFCRTRLLQEMETRMRGGKMNEFDAGEGCIRQAPDGKEKQLSGYYPGEKFKFPECGCRGRNWK